jgi:SAM-dependent methyltransferase
MHQTRRGSASESGGHPHLKLEPARLTWLGRVRRLVERSTTAYRFVLSVRGASRRPSPVVAQRMNCALRTREEAQRARDEVVRAGLIPHNDTPKNWDALAALALILSRGDRKDCILDAGGETYSPLVEWLFLHGYRCLHVINPVFSQSSFRRGPIRYVRGDALRTPYDSETFGVITCLSVIEHGLPHEPFLRECFRLLQPGGHVVVSTDYWSEPIETEGRTAYGAPVRIFTPAGVSSFIKTATALGFAETGRLDFSTEEKVVHWDSQGLDFTFLVFSLEKPV